MLPIPDLRAVVEQFVAAALRPALLDPGEEPFPLIADQWSVSEWNGRLVLQAWNLDRNLVRRIVSVKEQRRDRLFLGTERFPKAAGELQIADLAAYCISWGFRKIRDMKEPGRTELNPYSEQLARMRHRTVRNRHGNPNFEIWSFSYISDLRTHFEMADSQ